MGIIERLQKYMDFRELNPNRVTVDAGLSVGLIGKAIKKNSGLNSDTIEKILHSYTEINPEWFVLGTGEMLKPNIKKKQQFETVTKTVTSADKNEKYRKSNTFSEKTKSLEIVTVSNGNKNGNKNTKKQKVQKMLPNTELQPGYGRGIKLIPIEAMAGYGEGEIQVMDYEAGDYIVPEFEELNVDYMIRVKGSSMYPKYNSGDLIACKKLFLSDLFFQWNKVYVLSTEQGALVKRIHKGSNNEHILLVSDNPKYEPFEIHLSKVHSIALVVGVIRLE